FLFGHWLGLTYSSIGLTIGSIVAFGIGRWFGAHYVRAWVSQETWARMGFIVEAEGAILCFMVYAIPGLPKDIACYLFGLSPMSFWVFAIVSTIGRIPGTWALSAQGAKVASGQYLHLFLLTAFLAAAVLPLYYYRAQLLMRFRRPRRPVVTAAALGVAGARLLVAAPARDPAGPAPVPAHPSGAARGDLGDRPPEDGRGGQPGRSGDGRAGHRRRAPARGGRGLPGARSPPALGGLLERRREGSRGHCRHRRGRVHARAHRG